MSHLRESRRGPPSFWTTLLITVFMGENQPLPIVLIELFVRVS